MNYEWTKDTCGRWETMSRPVGLAWIDVERDGYATVYLSGYFSAATLRRLSQDIDDLMETWEPTP